MKMMGIPQMDRLLNVHPRCRRHHRPVAIACILLESFGETFRPADNYIKFWALIHSWNYAGVCGRIFVSVLRRIRRISIIITKAVIITHSDLVFDGQNGSGIGPLVIHSRIKCDLVRLT